MMMIGEEFGFLNSGGFELGLESGESIEREVVLALVQLDSVSILEFFFYHPARPASG